MTETPPIHPPPRHRLSRVLRPTFDPATGSVRKGFETKAGALKEDRRRIRLIGETLSAPSPKIRERGRRDKQAKVYRFDRAAALELRRKLQAGHDRGKPWRTLGSYFYMRRCREKFYRSISILCEQFDSDLLRIVTVLNNNWEFGANDLDLTEPKKIHSQFRTHLRRAGVTEVPGPLIGFVHGEFEPNSATYLVHYHLVTTATKAAALKKDSAGVGATQGPGQDRTPSSGKG